MNTFKALLRIEDGIAIFSTVTPHCRHQYSSQSRYTEIPKFKLVIFGFFSCFFLFFFFAAADPRIFKCRRISDFWHSAAIAMGINETLGHWEL